jgi:hypothetical protein
MASRAMIWPLLTAGIPAESYENLYTCGLGHFAIAIGAARLADMMRQFVFAAAGAFHITGGLQGIMGTAHVPFRCRYFSLWYCHALTLTFFR